MKKFYHGAKRHSSYFEGWYLKYQAKDGTALALIPALHIDRTGRRSASLQVITGDRTWWLDFPEREFGASAQRFKICFGKSTFDEEGVRLQVERDGLPLHEMLVREPFVPL